MTPEEEAQLEKDTSSVQYTFTSYQEIREFVGSVQHTAVDGYKVIPLDIERAIDLVKVLDPSCTHKVAFIKTVRGLTGASLMEVKNHVYKIFPTFPPVLPKKTYPHIVLDEPETYDMRGEDISKRVYGIPGTILGPKE